MVVYFGFSNVMKLYIKIVKKKVIQAAAKPGHQYYFINSFIRSLCEIKASLFD